MTQLTHSASRSALSQRTTRHGKRCEGADWIAGDTAMETRSQTLRIIVGCALRGSPKLFAAIDTWNCSGNRSCYARTHQRTEFVDTHINPSTGEV